MQLGLNALGPAPLTRPLVKGSSCQPHPTNAIHQGRCQRLPRTRRRLGRCSGPEASSTTLDAPSSTLSRLPGEHSLRLNEYKVVLDKPLGITLAPDPSSGQIVVQSIKKGFPAHNCGLVQVGDVVKFYSAVFGDDMWPALDIRRVHWAIENRSSKVKLVLERRGRKGLPPTWYSRGQVGCVSSGKEVMELPVSFASGSNSKSNNSLSSVSWGQDLSSPGRPLFASFHRCMLGPSQAVHSVSAACAARTARLEGIRKDLVQAGKDSPIQLTPARSAQPPAAPIQDAASSKRGPNNARNPAATGDAPAVQAQSSDKRKKAKKVTSVLPWLLVTSNHLSLRDLTHLASYCCLSSLLELGLVSSAGHLTLRGSEWQNRQPKQVDVSHLFAKNPEGTPYAPTKHSLPEQGGGGSTWPQPIATAAAVGSESASAAAASLRGPSSPPSSPAASQGSLRNPSSDVDRGGFGGVPIASNQGPGSMSSSGGIGTGLQGVGEGGQQTGKMSNGSGGKGPAAALVHAAAALHRLSIRRKYGNLQRADPSKCAVLLHCGPDMHAQVAGLFAGWLHWFCHLQMQEAILSAELALSCSIDQTVLEAATEVLVAGAIERANWVTLTWRYGGISASVAGDVVGGWQNHVPLQRNSVVVLNGLQPGTYYYKFIVDGVWAIDPLAPKVLDAGGNWNNVLKVSPKPPILTSKERLSMARRHALLIAFEAKMGLDRDSSP